MSATATFTNMAMTIEQVNEAMRRCPEQAVQAAISFQTKRDPALVPPIVLGIIERFVEPEIRPKVASANDETSLFDELGIDSLIMVEIVMTIEQVLGVSAPDEELRGLRTIGDVKRYLDAKLRGVPYQAGTPSIGRDEIMATLPQQPPFLFLTEARLNADGATGSYLIGGDEPALQGHFKDEAVFPASLMMEALGQLASLFILKSDAPELAGAKESGKAWFINADSVRCMRVCRPNDKLDISIKLLRARAPLATFNGFIEVDGQKAASVEALTLVFGPMDGATEKPASDDA